MMKVIDLRSDTVTRPCQAMRQAMADAQVGDDVYRDDPTVIRLEEMAADLLGFEAALLTASGTQANLVGILSHCGRGDEYLVGQQAHTYRYEAGGAAVFGSVQPQPIEFEEDGTLDLDKVADKVKPDDIHFARTRLLCLENTVGGQALPLDYLARARDFATSRGLALHLDGARLYNAAVACGVDVREITRHFDSTTLCLSKGLGAPVGSLLLGSRPLVEEARKWRKMAGGGMRQAGLLAAAGIYALEHNIPRLAEDHANAQLLAEGLQGMEQLRVVGGQARTNMLFVEADPSLMTSMAKNLAEQGILISPGKTTRFVTHLDITTKDIEATLQAITAFLNKSS